MLQIIKINPPNPKRKRLHEAVVLVNSRIRGHIVIYAHTKENRPKQEWQTIEDHLKNVAGLAEDICSKFSPAEWGYVLGMLHDVGKYNPDFQKYLETGVGKIDHSTPAAKLADTLYEPKYALVLAYILAGHHAGLADFYNDSDSSLKNRLSKDVFNAPTPESFQLKELRFPFELQQKSDMPKLFFFIKMLFSALVDSDFIDTELFMDPDRSSDRKRHYNIQKLNHKLHKYIEKFAEINVEHLSQKQKNVNEVRQRTLQGCLDTSNSPRGLFSLTAPTGAGKTISSMAFALNHAAINNMDRIIYVIPYTTIIDQTAKQFKKIFGRRYVLEHHSNFDVQKEKHLSEHTIHYLKLSQENWDMPIIVTTNVQFFESLFANKTSKCRKLHNIVNSVIVFDEVQILPPGFVRPCTLAIKELVDQYNCSAVLCTATQPTFTSHDVTKLYNVREMVPDTQDTFTKLDRVSINIAEFESTEGLTDKLSSYDQVLCIVNTRKLAHEVYDNLHGGNNFHLSTFMCPQHRMSVIKNIKKRLKTKKPCRVVSTQLIEAGVDIDFPVVYRMIAGIDSLSQAAGRCNREGKLEKGEFCIFTLWKGDNTPKSLKSAVSIAKKLLYAKDASTILSLETIENYFDDFFWLKGENGLDKREIIKMISNDTGRFQFKTIAENFRLITQNTYSLIVPYDNVAKRLINVLKYKINNKQPHIKLLRLLQPYVISVYEKEYNKLANQGKLYNITSTYSILHNRAYSERYGLVLNDDSAIII